MHQNFKYVFLLLSFTSFLVVFLINRSQFTFHLNFNNFDNTVGYYEKIIPNIVHYIIFDKHLIDFSAYLSILSSLKFQKPTSLYIHTDQLNFTGFNWDKIVQINKTKHVILINYISKPTHVYGQRLSSNFHASDVARIKVLQEWGGIYLDADTVLLKSLDTFRRFEMVVGWPKDQYMGTQILLAHKNARFLSKWLDGYKRYIPSNWYYNAGQYPTEQVLAKQPNLAHRVPDLFGVQNLSNELYSSNKNWTGWKEYYSIHLLSRHPPAPDYLDELAIKKMNNSFADIARFILFT